MSYAAILHGNLTLVLILPALVSSVDPDQLASELDLHCLSLSMWICSNNLVHLIWLAES